MNQVREVTCLNKINCVEIVASRKKLRNESWKNESFRKINESFGKQIMWQ